MKISVSFIIFRKLTVCAYSLCVKQSMTSSESALLISKDEKVTVKIYNMLGAEVYTNTSNLEKGIHNVDLNISDLKSGLYFVKVAVGNKVSTEKLTISK